MNVEDKGSGYGVKETVSDDPERDPITTGLTPHGQFVGVGLRTRVNSVTNSYLLHGRFDDTY